MSPPDGFLSRWSRRKLEIAKGGVAPDATPAAEAVPLGEPASAGPLPGASGAISAEELDALPRIEDLTAETDFLPFLRQGVPVVLRRAALRRMWTLDPAIRDFVGEARDYSYDWNVVGGVPVSGPLLPGSGAEATLARMFSRPLQEDAPLGLETSSGSEGPPPGAQPKSPLAAHAEVPAGGEPRSTRGGASFETDLRSASQDEEGGVSAAVETGVATDPEDAAELPAALPRTEAAPVRAPDGIARPRRHGAARPKLDSF